VQSFLGGGVRRACDRAKKVRFQRVEEFISETRYFASSAEREPFLLTKPSAGGFVNSLIRITPTDTSDDSLDWKDLPASEIINRVTSKVQPGSIILFHNAAKNTTEALPTIIEYLLQNGYSIVPVSQLLLQGSYTIDHTGRQMPA